MISFYIILEVLFVGPLIPLFELLVMSAMGS